MRAAELLLSKTGSLGNGIVVTRRALDPEPKEAVGIENNNVRNFKGLRRIGPQKIA